MTEQDEVQTAARIRSARVRVGLDERAMAERLGIGLPAYCDLERFDDELATCLSLDQVRRLAQVLRLSIAALIAADADATASGPAMSMTELIDRIRQRLVQEGLNVEAFSDRVGWDITAAMTNPDSAWRDWNIDCLRDVCAEMEIDSLRVLST
jgi:hypothetical protein